MALWEPSDGNVRFQDNRCPVGELVDEPPKDAHAHFLDEVPLLVSVDVPIFRDLPFQRDGDVLYRIVFEVVICPPVMPTGPQVLAIDS